MRVHPLANHNAEYARHKGALLRMAAGAQIGQFWLASQPAVLIRCAPDRADIFMSNN